ncbi:MAG: hypothetical protein AAF623_14420 [Planctomycetota bacterium]
MKLQPISRWPLVRPGSCNQRNRSYQRKSKAEVTVDDGNRTSEVDAKSDAILAGGAKSDAVSARGSRKVGSGVQDTRKKSTAKHAKG